MKPMNEPPGPSIQLPIAEFDQLARERQFQVGPFIETFGDGPYDPYIPSRRVWGILRDGRKVESEKNP